jgi:valyl-tRNA synthetase
MNTEGQDCGQTGGACEYSVADRWIRSRLGATIEQARTHLADYRFDLAAQTLYEFAWYEYCDWYLELSKPTLQSGESSDAQKRGTRQTLVRVLEAYLRLLHPLMPFITDEVWQSVAPLAGRRGETIMLQPYPLATEFPRDEAAERAIAPIRAAILGARQIRGQLDVPQSREIAVYFQSADRGDAESLNASSAVIQSVGRITKLEIVVDDAGLPPSATASVDGRTVYSPLAALIDDPDAELSRLAKRKTKARQDLGKAETKLSNQNFVASAPPEIVEQERGRVTEFQRQIAQIEEQERRVALLKQ